MRGKQKGDHGDEGGHRIIPAHAGQTLNHGTCWKALTDHPRACGANSLIPLTNPFPTMPKKFDLHSRSRFANIITIPDFLLTTPSSQFNIVSTIICQNGDIVMHCSTPFYEMRPEISHCIHPDHEVS